MINIPEPKSDQNLSFAYQNSAEVKPRKNLDNIDQGSLHLVLLIIL